MKRHFQLILEVILSVLILIDVLLLSLMTVGLIVGIHLTTIYSISTFDLIVAILILLDLIFYRIKNRQTNFFSRVFFRDYWFFFVAIIPLTFICFNIFHLFNYTIIIGLIGIFRIYALYRVLLIGSSRVRKYPSKTKLDYATIVLFLVLIIGSYLFFIAEHAVNPEVSTYESAMWYSIVSMTTVGYGDIVPITAIGRIIGVIIILTGMGYVSLVTATLAYSFLDFFRKESRKAAEKVENRVVDYEDKLDELIMQVNKLEKKIDENKKDK
jgi:voltage-gated potassium channel